MKNNYYIGLDMGTSSVGYAAAYCDYRLVRFGGENVWGVELFDEAENADSRRAARSARRRLNRRQQRVQLVKELFASEIAKKDKLFFARIEESALHRTDSAEPYCIFNDKDYTDKDYHKDYPTIHHLIDRLMYEDKPFDVRLVYLAVVWLVVHRGHFLSDVSKNDISGLKDFSVVYENMVRSYNDRDTMLPWDESKKDRLEEILKENLSCSAKAALLKKEVLSSVSSDKNSDVSSMDFFKLISGAKISPVKLFIGREDYTEIESFSLASDDETIASVCAQLDDIDAELIMSAKSVYDWTLLINILKGSETISKAKIRIYECHKEDLKLLKRLVKKYIPGKYNDIFRSDSNISYGKYISSPEKREDFIKGLKKLLNDIKPDEADKICLEDAIARIETGEFLPVQVNSDNRVIPYQLYWHELDCILKRSEKYLDFLAEKDEKGISVSDKLRMVFEFRVPYFVGPLNAHSDNSWFVRREGMTGRIYPWNIKDIVDYDKSEEEFIKRMTNTCTYIHGEPVLPKGSLLYHKFTVLNELNNIKINDQLISVELKQELYNELFMKYRKVKLKKLTDYLTTHNYLSADDKLSGIDEQIRSDLTPYHDFKNLISENIITENDAENIITHITCSSDRNRLKKWVRTNYSQLNDADVDYISRLKYADFGRLSRRFLTEIYDVSSDTGEAVSIIQALWDTNNNLMELLSGRFGYSAQINKLSEEFYADNNRSVEALMSDMYLANPVKRTIYRANEIVKDIISAVGHKPEKIFIEMTRGEKEENKNQRTSSRLQQILALYDKCKNEDVSHLRRQLEEMGESANTKLQSIPLFLYYMQLGKCMYTGKPIELAELSSRYNKEHIYPQSAVKDDSILNNLVLVDSKANGDKSNDYPIAENIRKNMYPFWKKLLSVGLITEEKFKRLTRSEPFSQDEKWGFVNRQLTETSQSAKAAAEIFKKLYPDIEIVYVKSRLASEFRQKFGCLKSRSFNDLHHAKDAYLNIVAGNVYHSRFTEKWFLKNYMNYNIKTEKIYTTPFSVGSKVIWDGEDMLKRVIRTVEGNHAHMTKYAYCKTHGQNGGFFDQNPMPKGAELISRKKHLDTEKYGGYRGATVSYFMLVKYFVGKKSDIMIMPVRLFDSRGITENEASAEGYAKQRIGEILGKKVTSVSFPLGLRKLKINTILSADGFRVCLSGNANKGERVLILPFMYFSADVKWNNYMKYLENFIVKTTDNPAHIYSAEYDKVTEKENTELYDIYIDKLTNSVYSKRPNNCCDIVVKGREKFIKLDIADQSRVLINIHQLFCRLSGGCDLTLIGGSKNSGRSMLSSNLSNWKKYYSDVRIIDSSHAGLRECRSVNLLELL